jgi:hypothetical protein
MSLGTEKTAASPHLTRKVRFTAYSGKVCKKIFNASSTLLENKSGKPRKTLRYVVLFLICASFVLTVLPSLVEADSFSTFATVSVNPYVVGVGQKVEVAIRVTPPPPTGNVFHRYRVVITKPDGINETVVPSPSDNSGFATITFTPQVVGTFYTQLFFDGEDFSNGDFYGVSSSTSATFFVQQSPVSLLLTTTVSGSGSTNPAAGVYGHSPGESVSVSAQPSPGWTFDHWLLNGTNVGSSNPYNLTMFINRNLTAVFTQLQYSLNTSFSGSGNIYPASGTYLYPSYNVVNVSATPNSGWNLSYWMVNGVNVGSSNPYPITMDANKTLTAVFTQIQYSLNITITGSGNTNPTPGVHPYLSGTTVNVNSNPNSGWALSYWTLNGVNVGSGSSYSVTMDANKTLTAVFTQIQYSLNIIVSGSGTTIPSTGVHPYLSGTTVNVNANPANGWMLSYWSLNGAKVGNASSYVVSMTADSTLTAVFVPQPPQRVLLNLNVNGSGSTNPDVGQYTYDAGTTIQLNAQPNANWGFNCWLLNGKNVSQVSDYSVTLNSDCALVAVFLQNNSLPNAVIESISPSSASSGQQVTLVGHGNDADGNITGYRWISNIDGLLSTSPRFSTTNLSVGRHTISFEVQDNVGAWSVKSEQLIDIEATTSLSLVAISVAAVAGSIGVAAGTFFFRGKLGKLFKSKGQPRKNTDSKDNEEKKEDEKKKDQKEKGSIELKTNLPPKILKSKTYQAQINLKNTGNSTLKDILISALATPGISIRKSEKKISVLEAGQNCDQVFPFKVEKNLDRGFYVLRFDVKSREIRQQTQIGSTSLLKIGFLSNSKKEEQEAYRNWLSEHSYVWDELSSADDLCNSLLNYDLLIVPPEVELQKQWAINAATFVRGGQSLLIMGNPRSAETELLAKTLGYTEISYEESSSNQRPIRVLNQHPLVSGFMPGEQINLMNCWGNVCVSKNRIGTVVAEYPNLNGKSNVPAIIVREDKGKVAYLNFQSNVFSPKLNTLLKNTIEWLIEPKQSIPK